MSCTIRNINNDGSVSIDPILNKVLNYLDGQTSLGGVIEYKKLLEPLQTAGLVTANGEINTYKTTRPMEILGELNGILMASYGAVRPPLVIRAVTTNTKLEVLPAGMSEVTFLNKQTPGYKYYVSIDNEALQSLERRDELQFSNVNDIEDFTIEAFNIYKRSPNLQMPTVKFNPGAIDAVRKESDFIQYVVKSQVVSTLTNRVTGYYTNSSKEVGIDVESTTPKDIATQVAFFQSAFLNAGVEVTFEYDTELPEKGKVIAEVGKPVRVILNPTLMTADTHIHEFGHILVELLGVDHPAVKAAIAELKDTNLYKTVQEQYPELSPEDLDKEVVVTAIGLSGAKINRKNPNFFQKIINRIIRALSRRFNTTESAVEKLTNTLLSGQFKSEIYQKPLVYFEAKSKARTEDLRKKFEELKDEVKISLTNKIAALERNPIAGNEAELAKLNVMRNSLDGIKQIEQLSEFIDYAVGLATKADITINNVLREYSEDLPEDKRLELLNKLHTVAQSIKEFYGESDFTKPNKSLMGKMSLLVDEKLGLVSANVSEKDLENNPIFQKLNNFEQRIATATKKMSIIANKYQRAGIPMLADLYLNYNATDMEDEINVVIDNIKTNNRLIALKKDEEYLELAKEFKEKAITKEEFEKAKIDLNIKQLQNMKIGRETLIKELTEAQKDKSAFSYLLDPLVHSSQVSLQLFSIMLKNKFYEANDVTQETIVEVGEALRKFSETKGSAVNVNSFNEDVLEIHEYYEYNRTTGKKETMRILSMVQPLDVTKFKKAERAMYEALGKEFTKPDRGTDDATAWSKTSAAREYYKKVAEWYKENSIESPDAKENLKKLLDKKAKISEKLAEAIKNNNTDLQAYYEDEKLAVNASISLIYDPVTKQFKNGAVQPNPKIYANPKYEALKSNPAAFEYYTTLLNVYKAKQKLLGKTNQVKNSWENFSYAVPTILSDALEKVQRNGAISTIKLEAKEKIGYLSTDINYGDLVNANRESIGKVVPIFFTSPTDESLVSRDIASSIIQFAGMANMFKVKSELHGAVTMMREAIQTRDIVEVSANGNPVVHSMSKMLSKTRFVKKDGVSNNFKHLSEFIDTIFYGEEDIKQNFDIFGRELSSTKLASKVASYTAMNNLAFNMLQVTNQLLLDNVRLTEEAVAGQFMTAKDLVWAKKEFHLKLGGLSQTRDLGKLVPDSKMLQAIEYFDGLQDVLGIANRKQSGPRTLRLAKELPMAAQQLVENETAVTRMLALLHATRGKLKDKDGNVILNEQGKPAHLWDLFVKNEKTGRFEIDPKVANAALLRRQVTQRISGLTKKTNQIKNKFDDAVLQRRWYGKLIMLFRRYFMPSLRRYWGHQGLSGGLHRDMEMGVLSEGIMHSVARLFRDTYMKNGNIVGAYSLMTPMEKQNIKRFGVQSFFFVVASLIAMSLAGDDDDEESYAEQFTLYQALRLKAELVQFLQPMEFIKMVESPMASIRTVTAIANLINHITTEEIPYLITGDEDGLYYEKKSGIHAKGDSKFVAKVGKILPYISGIEKSSSPEEAAKWFQLGAGSGK